MQICLKCAFYFLFSNIFNNFLLFYVIFLLFCLFFQSFEYVLLLTHITFEFHCLASKHINIIHSCMIPPRVRWQATSLTTSCKFCTVQWLNDNFAKSCKIASSNFANILPILQSNLAKACTWCQFCKMVQILQLCTRLQTK